MPRRRHEERSSSYSSSSSPSPRSSSSSYSSSSSPSPRSERRSSSRSRTTATRSPSPQTSGRSSSPRPAPATSSVAASVPPSPPASVAGSTPPRSQSPRTESSTPHTASSSSYRAKRDGDYSMFEGMVRGLLRGARSDDRASSDLSYKATNDGENLFGSMIRALICPRPVVVSEDASTALVEVPVAAPVSPCDTQAKTFQDCLQDFESDISKCQFYMNVLSQCKKFSASKLK